MLGPGESMKAWRIHEHGDYRDVLSWDECPDPQPTPDGIVVDVAASGINFADLLAIAGTYQVKPPLPFSPGLEAAGVVSAAGSRSRWKLGDRVVVSAACGAHAERIAIPDVAALAIPDGMSDADAAALEVIYQTAYFALTVRTQVAAGEVLLVHGGAGGIGTAAIQLGKTLGMSVIATAGTADKLNVCRDAGADHVVNYRTDDFVDAVKDITRGRGADVIYDPVGGDVFDQSTKCIAFGGRLLVIGFASGRIPELRLNRLMVKNFSVIGLYWGAYQQHAPQLIAAAHDELCAHYGRGEIAPVIYRDLPLREYPSALDALRSRASYGKIVLHTDR